MGFACQHTTFRITPTSFFKHLFFENSQQRAPCKPFISVYNNQYKQFLFCIFIKHLVRIVEFDNYYIVSFDTVVVLVSGSCLVVKDDGNWMIWIWKCGYGSGSCFGCEDDVELDDLDMKLWIWVEVDNVDVDLVWLWIWKWICFGCDNVDMEVDLVLVVIMLMWKLWIMWKWF